MAQALTAHAIRMIECDKDGAVSVLLIGDVSNDTSFLFVQKQLEHKLGQSNVYVLNFGDLGISKSLSLSMWDQTWLININDSKTAIDLSNVKSVWFRRYHTPRIVRDLSAEFAEMTERNWDHLFYMLPEAITKAKWLNHPLRHFDANFRIAQLTSAKRLGLKIPSTLISNSTQKVFEFYEQNNKNIICKLLLSSYKGVGTKTIKLKGGNLHKNIETITYMPSIFQEAISLGVDIRVYVVGDKVFSAEVNTASGEDDTDWRLSPVSLSG